MKHNRVEPLFGISDRTSSGRVLKHDGDQKIVRVDVLLPDISLLDDTVVFRYCMATDHVVFNKISGNHPKKRRIGIIGRIGKVRVTCEIYVFLRPRVVGGVRNESSAIPHDVG